MKNRLALVVGMLLILAASSGTFAQTTPTPPAEVNKDDVLILVNLTAKELKFDSVPNPKVEFPGTQERTKIWITDRFNLPDKVEPGVTYRNIGITLRIESRFEDIEKIVREALGETADGAAQPAPAASAKVNSAAPPKGKDP